jgi:hypothetical protein
MKGNKVGKKKQTERENTKPIIKTKKEKKSILKRKKDYSHIHKTNSSRLRVRLKQKSSRESE